MCCVFVPSIGGSPSVQGETCATLCSVFRRLHLLSVLSVQLEPNGVTQEGVNNGAFSSFYVFFFAPPSSCGACLHVLSREGFGRPYSSSTSKLIFVYSRSFSAIYRFPLPGTKVRKKNTLAEIRTRDRVARRLRGSTRPPVQRRKHFFLACLSSYSTLFRSFEKNCCLHKRSNQQHRRTK